MAQKIIVIPVSEEESNKLEALNYEVTSRIDVIAFMIDTSKKTNTDSFRAYQAELAEFKKQYERAKKDFEERIVKKYLSDHGITAMVNWNLDFKDRELSISYEEDNEE